MRTQKSYCPHWEALLSPKDKANKRNTAVYDNAEDFREPALSPEDLLIAREDEEREERLEVPELPVKEKLKKMGLTESQAGLILDRIVDEKPFSEMAMERGYKKQAAQQAFKQAVKKLKAGERDCLRKKK